MSKKIITTEEKKPVLKIIILIVLVIAVISMTLIIAKTKKKEDTPNDAPVVDDIVEVDSGDVEIDPNNKDPESEETESTNKIEITPNDVESDSNEEDIKDEEEDNEDDEQKGKWEIGKNGPKDPEPVLSLTPEEKAKAKTGGYYDGAWVSEIDLLGSMIGPGYRDLPDWIPRFYDVDSLELLEEVAPPRLDQYNENSTLTIDILNSIDITNEKNLPRIKFYEESLGSPIYENLDVLKNGMNRGIEILEPDVGFRANNEYYEHLAASELTYVRNMMYAEAKKEDHPYKEVLRALILKSANSTGDELPHYENFGYTDEEWYNTLGYWLEHGGEIDPEKNKDKDSVYSYMLVGSSYHKDFSKFKTLFLWSAEGKDGKNHPIIEGTLDGEMIIVNFVYRNGILKVHSAY